MMSKNVFTDSLITLTLHRGNIVNEKRFDEAANIQVLG